jgi:hypothetical protein
MKINSAQVLKNLKMIKQRKDEKRRTTVRVSKIRFDQYLKR